MDMLTGLAVALVMMRLMSMCSLIRMMDVEITSTLCEAFKDIGPSHSVPGNVTPRFGHEGNRPVRTEYACHLPVHYFNTWSIASRRYPTNLGGFSVAGK
jgi:hypothetical protein